MRLPEFVRTTTFRWTIAVTCAFVACTLLLFSFVYLQTAAYMTSGFDDLIVGELHLITSDSPARRVEHVNNRLRDDPRRIKLAGLFGADGHRIAGNIESVPPGQIPDVPSKVDVVRLDGRGREIGKALLVTDTLPGGEVLAIGRNLDDIEQIAEIVRRALTLGLLPAFALALITGFILSSRANKRLLEVNRRINDIMAGDLRQRLPTRSSADPFDQFADSVNRMLNEIETLIHEIAATGDNIAHDLRTPLTRVRMRLERGREHAATLPDLQTATDQAITGLDQSLAIITGLLRISEIEHSRRLSGFSNVPLAPLLREVGDLYDPIAEDKRVTLKVSVAEELTVHGDRDLLFEAITNLVDNAVKFTPGGGHIELALLSRDQKNVISVTDSGPGISESEQDDVTKRFFRSDKSRGTQGLGLGLSLVAAIVKLHGFRLSITPGPGCKIEMMCDQIIQ